MTIKSNLNYQINVPTFINTREGERINANHILSYRKYDLKHKEKREIFKDVEEVFIIEFLLSITDKNGEPIKKIYSYKDMGNRDDRFLELDELFHTNITYNYRVKSEIEKNPKSSWF
jgi:hypothetical protein